VRDMVASFDSKRSTSGIAARLATLALPAFRLRTWRMNWRGAVSVAAFVLLWELLVRFGGGGFEGIPTLAEVLSAFWSKYVTSTRYWQSWIVSSERVVYGFALAQLLGIPLGLLLGTRRAFHEVVYPVVELLRPIPPLAWVPLSILFWPTAELSIIFITFIGPFFIIIINVHDAVRSLRKEHLWLAQSLGAMPGYVFRRIILPALIPAIAVGMTLGIAVSWNVVIAAEMIASDVGLGRLTWEGYVSHTATTVIVGMISIGLAGYLSGLVVSYVERRLMPWQK
jgi:NitT/TauT family transport system permease protein